MKITKATRPAHYKHREWFGAWISAVFGKPEKYQHMKLRHHGYVIEYSTKERRKVL